MRSTRFWWKPKISIFDLRIKKRSILYCDGVSMRLTSDDRVTYDLLLHLLSNYVAFTSAVWIRLESEVSCHCRCEHVTCLLYFQTKALCFRQQISVQMMLSCTHPYSRAKLSAAHFLPRMASYKRTVLQLASTQPWHFCWCKWPHWVATCNLIAFLRLYMLGLIWWPWWFWRSQES